MKSSIILMILLQIVLIALNAVFACAEIAVISMNDNKLEKMAAKGDKRAIRLSKLTEQPARFLATIQVAITLSGFLGSAFAAENFSDGLVNLAVKLGVPISPSVLDSISVILITIILSYVTLIFGELVPKRVAMKKAESLALGMSGLTYSISKIFAPLVSMLTASTNFVLRLIGIDPEEEDEDVSEEEIRMMVDVGSEKGTIDHEEREFIQNVFEFDDLSADEILTHRTDVITLDMEESLEKWKEIIFNTKHTLYPVCDGSIDKIIGVLDSKKYFRLEDKNIENIIKNTVSKAYYVPDTIKADDLFRNMRKTGNTMAVVLDEYGGTAGIITINDLVEQLVGDLEEDNEIVKIDDVTCKVKGIASLDELSKQMGVSLSTEEYDTIGGLIFHVLQSIPEKGENIEFDFEGIKVMDVKIYDHKVVSAVVKKNSPNEEDKDNE